MEIAVKARSRLNKAMMTFLFKVDDDAASERFKKKNQINNFDCSLE